MPCMGGWFCACLCNCSRNCASACRSSCIRLWISSSEAPSSSALDRRSWAARSARSASVRLPSSMRSAMFHSCAITLLRPAARAVALQAPVGRAQAEIDLQVLDELLRLQRQRIERAGDLQAVARVLDQPAPLLDDGARQRLVEAPLRQHHLDRSRCGRSGRRDPWRPASARPSCRPRDGRRSRGSSGPRPAWDRRAAAAAPAPAAARRGGRAPFLAPARAQAVADLSSLGRNAADARLRRIRRRSRPRP